MAAEITILTNCGRYQIPISLKFISWVSKTFELERVAFVICKYQEITVPDQSWELLSGNRVC